MHQPKHPGKSGHHPPPRPELHRLLCALFTAALLAALPSVCLAGVWLESNTIIRYYERDTATDEDQKVIPAYEYFGLEAQDVGVEGLSIHANGWGRHDFGDGIFEDDTEGEILYGYLQYVDEGRTWSARLGRQQVFDAAVQEVVDGLGVSFAPHPTLSLSAYGGLPASMNETSGISGDMVAGGRIGHRIGPFYNLGLSYKYLQNDGDRDESLFGVDFALHPLAQLSLTGYAAYNEEVSALAQQYYEATVRLGLVEVKPFYEQIDYEGFFSTGEKTGSPFRLLAESDETLTSYGATLAAYLTDRLDVIGKVKSYSHEDSDQDALYGSVLVRARLGDGADLGAEAGLMDGDIAENRYSLYRVFFYVPAGKRMFVSGDALYALYDEEILGEDASIFASLGAGYGPFAKGLTIKLSGDYSSDPYFDSDVRGMLTLIYAYDTTEE